MLRPPSEIRTSGSKRADSKASPVSDALLSTILKYQISTSTYRHGTLSRWSLWRFYGLFPSTGKVS